MARKKQNKPLFAIAVLVVLGIIALSIAISNVFTGRIITVPAVYYVSSSLGNDANDGSMNSPWNTIAKVNARIFNPGDSILFRRGDIWNEQLNIPSSGISGNPITFATYGIGNKPVINGGGIRSYAVNSNSKSYIAIKDLTLTNALDSGIRALGANWIIDNCDINENDNNGISAGVGSDNISILNSNISRNGHIGISFYTSSAVPPGKGKLIENNTISNNGWNSARKDRGQGIFIGASDSGYTSDEKIVIKGNNIFNNGELDCYSTSGSLTSSECHGIYINIATFANPVGIYNNEIHDQKRGHGMSIRASANIYGNLIYNNHMKGIMPMSWPSNSRINISYNIFYGNAWGIGADGGNTNTVTLGIYNNVFYKDYQNYTYGTAEIMSDPISGKLSIKNNIIYADSRGYGFDLSQSNAEVDYNDRYGGGLDNYGGGSYNQHGLALNPGFVDESSRNFRLQTSSPVIDKGINIGLIQDFAGNQVPQGSGVDIGAYENSSSSPSQPVCIDNDRDGFNATSGCGIIDCNDNNNSINPSSSEKCDGVDNNCNGLIDEGLNCTPSKPVCWSSTASMYSNSYQYKKFCKCVMGVYGYVDRYTLPSFTGNLTKYTNTGDNSVWNTTIVYVRGSNRITKVQCTDYKWYNVTATYYAK